MRPPSPADVLAAISAADLEFSIFCGFLPRWAVAGGEVAALRWSNIDLDAGELVISHVFSPTVDGSELGCPFHWMSARLREKAGIGPTVSWTSISDANRSTAPVMPHREDGLDTRLDAGTRCSCQHLSDNHITPTGILEQWQAWVEFGMEFGSATLSAFACSKSRGL